jgi:hypothetical protein
MNWDVVSEEKLTAGDYNVEIYAEGVQIGQSSFELK